MLPRIDLHVERSNVIRFEEVVCIPCCGLMYVFVFLSPKNYVPCVSLSLIWIF